MIDNPAGTATVEVDGYTITSSTESAADMIETHKSRDPELAEPREVTKGEPEKSPLSKAASELGKEGGKAAAKARAAAVKDSDSTDETDATPEPEPAKADEEKPRKGAGDPRLDPKARVTEATRQAAEERRARQQVEQRLAATEAELARLRNGAPAPQKDAQNAAQPAGDGKPKEEDFETYADYVDAITDWKVERKLQERERSAQEQRQAHEYAQKAATSVRAFNKRMSDAVQADPDFWNRLDPRVDELLKGAEPSFNVPPGERNQLNAVVDELIKSERPDKLMLHFSEHVEEFSRILSLGSRSEIARAVALIEGGLAGNGNGHAAPTPKQEASRAKPPVKPVTASAQSGSDEFSDDDSYDEHVRKANAKERRGR